jgi:hypothetical protein
MSSLPNDQPSPYRNQLLDAEQDYGDSDTSVGHGKFMAIVAAAIVVAVGLAVLLSI